MRDTSDHRGCSALLLLTFLAVVPNTIFASSAPALPPPPAAPDAHSSDEAVDSVDPEQIRVEEAWLREAQTALLAQQLTHLLRATQDSAEGDMWHQGALAFDSSPTDEQGEQELWSGESKRSRYYRRYPWKRQPGRGGIAASDIDNPYLCNPTREDVFQLLAALHEARAGNVGRTVSFCNRRRPAASVFTNIRFLGRRRR